jgi:GMP synthase (glutamine-hydrolysing)
MGRRKLPRRLKKGSALVRTAIAIRHLAFEDLGAFEEPLASAGYRIEYRDIGVDPLSPSDTTAADLLIVLGGPIGAYQDDQYPFLPKEIALIEQRLSIAKPTIGICLGAQLMARALGARVYPGPEKEIGFAPITLTVEGRDSCLAALDGPVLHWHGDTFDLPAGATLLASTAICENQAFSFGRNAIGFQFHPEAGGPGFERWLIGHTLELDQAGKDIVKLRVEHQALADGLKRRAAECLRAWLEQTES